MISTFSTKKDRISERENYAVLNQNIIYTMTKKNVHNHILTVKFIENPSWNFSVYNNCPNRRSMRYFWQVMCCRDSSQCLKDINDIT